MVTSSEVALRYRKQLMRRHTKGEVTMKKLLKSLGYRFHQQHIIPNPHSFYILDFLLLPGCDVAIEVDGDHHLFNPHQREWDLMRDKYLKSIGITMIRVNNRALMNSEYDATRRWLKKTIDRLRFKQTRIG
jgi:very-short-patch-repair endonuclease